MRPAHLQNLPATPRRGASDTALAFLDNFFRVAEYPPVPSSFGVLLPSMQCSFFDEGGNLLWSGGVDRVAGACDFDRVALGPLGIPTFQVRVDGSIASRH